MNDWTPISEAPDGRTVLTRSGACLNFAHRHGDRWFRSDCAGELAPPDEFFELHNDSMERFEAFKAALRPSPRHSAGQAGPPQPALRDANGGPVTFSLRAEP